MSWRQSSSEESHGNKYGPIHCNKDAFLHVKYPPKTKSISRRRLPKATWLPVPPWPGAWCSWLWVILGRKVACRHCVAIPPDLWAGGCAGGRLSCPAGPTLPPAAEGQGGGARLRGCRGVRGARRGAAQAGRLAVTVTEAEKKKG